MPAKTLDIQDFGAGEPQGADGGSFGGEGLWKSQQPATLKGTEVIGRGSPEHSLRPEEVQPRGKEPCGAQAPLPGCGGAWLPGLHQRMRKQLGV